MRRLGAFLVIVIGFPTLVVLAGFRLGFLHLDDQDRMSARMGQAAVAKLSELGHPGLTFSDVNCTPRYGNDPTQPDDWDCAAIDSVGDALSWGVRVSGGRFDLGPIQGLRSP